jgi:hypothetical protein
LSPHLAGAHDVAGARRFRELGLDREHRVCEATSERADSGPDRARCEPQAHFVAWGNDVARADRVRELGLALLTSVFSDCACALPANAARSATGTMTADDVHGVHFSSCE